MKQALLHIFDNSVCLSRRQFQEYISGSMADEEVYAVESHINGCSICNDALDGIFGDTPKHAAALRDTASADFIREHFQRTTPQIHLNSMAPVTPLSQDQAAGYQRKKTVFPPWLSLIPVGAALALAFFLLRNREDGGETRTINVPQQLETAVPAASQSAAETAGHSTDLRSGGERPSIPVAASPDSIKESEQPRGEPVPVPAETIAPAAVEPTETEAAPAAGDGAHTPDEAPAETTELPGEP